jgi:predicted RNase H-like HicB family nuclease
MSLEENARRTDRMKLVAKSEKITLVQEGEWHQPQGKVYRCQVYLVPEREGGFSVIASNLPGVASQGDTEEEALRNVVEAFEGVFAVYKESGKDIPWTATREPEPGATTRWVIVNG